MSKDDAISVTPSEPAASQGATACQKPPAPLEPAVTHNPPATHEGPTLPGASSSCPRDTVEPSIGPQLVDPMFVVYVETAAMGAVKHINTVTTSGSTTIFTPYDATFAPHECSVQVRSDVGKMVVLKDSNGGVCVEVCV